jgi:hypothetical protein
MLIAAGKNGDERFSLEAVAEFVGVRVPMRFAEASGIQRETVDGEPVEDRKVGFVDGGFSAAVVRNLGRDGAEGGFVGHTGNTF